MSGACCKVFFAGVGPDLNPFLDSSTLVTEELTYFKSAGVREIEFARIVKASLQLGKSAKSPQTSTPVPGWEICGDSEHFRPPRKMRAAKIASTPTGTNRKKGAEPWRIRTSHLGSEGTGLQATWVQGVTAGYLEEGGHCGGRACASGVGNAGVAGLGALRGPMVFPTLREGRPSDLT